MTKVQLWKDILAGIGTCRLHMSATTELEVVDADPHSVQKDCDNLPDLDISLQYTSSAARILTLVMIYRIKS